MTKKLSRVAFIMCLISSMFWETNAQSFKCGTDQQMEILYKNNANALLESNILRKKVSRLKKSKSAEPYVIPVIFHVFGTEFNKGSTVTLDIIKDALQRSNEDFQGLNADYTTIDAPFDAIKQPLKITFKLAKLDPSGNPTTGVVFYDEASGMGDYFSPIVPRVAWDNYKYCNIYITRDLYGNGEFYSSGVAWYPDTSASNNNLARIVYNGSFLGDNTSENFRSVLTHEFGHWLDLPHTFAGGICNDNPDDGDGIADTPSHKKDSAGTDCRIIQNCLNQEINNENFMDYTDCYKMFTQGQIARMNNALENSPARNTLWTDANLTATGLSFDLGTRIVISANLFEERYLNDGIIESTIDLTCVGCTFTKSSGNLTLNTDYTVTNLPAGLTERIELTSNTTATIHLENTTSNHELANSISNLTFTFLESMVTGGVAQLYNNSLDNLTINFIDEYTQYCNVKIDYTDYSYITNVEFAGKTNPSGGYDGKFTSDYTRAIYPVKRGKSYPITITTNKGIAGIFKDNNRIQGWFDWNNNFIFEENELIISHSYSNKSTDENGNYTYTTNIEIPTSIDLGNTGFRILVSDISNGQGGQSCSSVGSGEFEDYRLNIIEENAPFNMDFYANYTTVNFSQKVTFSDLIITKPNNSITSWQWTFEGGQPASSTEKNPTVIFPEEGIYDVTLQVITASGTNQTITKTDYILSELKYCDSAPNFGGYFDVTRVTLGTIDHEPLGSRSISYYNTVSTTLIAGNTYPITIKTIIGNGEVNDVNRVRVWADWNFDGTWSQDEMIVNQKVHYADYTNDEYEFTTNITIPSNAKAGKKVGLRVVGHFVDGKGGETSCGKYDSGNTADYGILISNPVYCDASNQDNSAHITRVTFSNVDNSSAHNSYSDYTTISDSFLVGDQFALAVKTNNDNLANNTLGAWVDWNNDGVFDNDTEKVLQASGTGPYSSNVTVPASAVLNTALRLRVRLGPNLDSTTPCGANTYSGEVEDYSVLVYIDVDKDSVLDHIDKCFNTPSGESVNENGCSQSQIDTDGDGVSDFDNVDKCPNTPSGESVNTAGCSQSQIVYIPDDNFEYALIDLGYDTGRLDDYVISANIESILYLRIDEYGIADLTGVEAFTSLTELICIFNQLTSLDLSKNTALTSLLCYNNQLTSLYLSKNTALTRLNCAENQLTSLDVSKNTALTFLSCSYNQLISLNVSQNTNLTELDCGSNQLMSLDVSSNTALTYLVCSSNQLRSLNVKNGNNRLITTFYAYDNLSLKCIQVDDAEWSTNNWIDIDSTVIFSEDCSNVDTDGDGISDNIDICPNTPSGESVNASGCSDSQTDADGDGVSDNVDTCPNTPTGESVNASGCSEAQADTDDDGVFDNIDICPNTPSGESVNASGCSESQTDADDDGVFDNVDTCPNTPTGESANASGCSPSQVDTDSDGVFDNIDICPNTPIGETANASGCSQSQIVYIPDDNFEQALIDLKLDTGALDNYIPTANINIIRSLDLSNLGITDLTGIEGFTSLTTLYCSSNQLTSLDLSKNTALTFLACSYNQLISLNVSQNTILTKLRCDSNKLRSLDVSSNTALTELFCSTNQLRSLNVKNGNNRLITTFYAYGNSPYLNCIQVDDAEWSTNNWTNIDSTTIFNEDCSNVDTDGDGVSDNIDICPNTPTGETVNASGCSESQTDADGDGVFDDVDICPNTPTSESVNASGCSDSQTDADGDGVLDNADTCPNTPTGETVNASGCSDSQTDADGDGVFDDVDICPNTPTSESANASGCSPSQVDTDNDGVFDNIDTCPNTPTNETANASGCSSSQVDTDNDGVFDNIDTCPNTPTNETANASGCSSSQVDTDNDGVFDNIDTCPNTPSGESVNENGCSQSQIDADGDGVFDNADQCSNTPLGESVNENGCSQSQTDADGDGVFDNADQCNNTQSGESVNAVGCIQLSSNNFEISSTTPKCLGINNGKISIKNLSRHTFNFVVTGPNSYNKTFENISGGEPLVIEDLAVGTYNIIAKFSATGTGQDITGFQTIINSATSVSGVNKSIDILGKSSVFTVSGDKKYSIYINDVFQRFETFSDEGQYEITVNNLSVGENHIKIIPENKCRGLIEGWITIPNSNVKFYPNPAVDLFHIGGLESSDITVQIFAYNGQLVYSKNHKSVNGIVYFSIRDLPAGLYIIRVFGKKAGDNINFKITKR